MEYLDIILSASVSAISLIASTIISLIKTKQKSINKKVDTAMQTAQEMKKYYINIDGKKYALADLTIYKED